jgi:hypothetical protein
MSHTDFTPFREHLEHNQTRPIPTIEAPQLNKEQHTLLLESLREFQLGEAGEGKIAHEIDSINWFNHDANLKKSVKLWVKEEGRHARILGLMVNSMGGTLRTKHWTAKLFEKSRRAFGPAMKLLVALSAEVVGGAFYDLLAKGLKGHSFSNVLFELAQDEESHLQFQAAIFKGLAQSRFQKSVFVFLWCLISILSGVLVYARHNQTLHSLGIEKSQFRSEIISRAKCVLTLVSNPRESIQAAVPLY